MSSSTDSLLSHSDGGDDQDQLVAAAADHMSESSAPVDLDAEEAERKWALRSPTNVGMLGAGAGDLLEQRFVGKYAEAEY